MRSDVCYYAPHMTSDVLPGFGFTPVLWVCWPQVDPCNPVLPLDPSPV